jgi:hypothetical protein
MSDQSPVRPDRESAATKPWFQQIRYLILFIIMLGSAWLMVDIIKGSTHRSEYAHALAEVDHVKHGLLSAREWAKLGSTLALKKLDAFKVTPTRRANLLPLIESSLAEVVSAIERKVETLPAIKRGLARWLVNKELHASRLPGIAKRILSRIEFKLNEPETKGRLKILLKAELHKVEKTTLTKLNHERLAQIMMRYACADRAECNAQLTSKIEIISSELKNRAIAVLLLITLLVFGALFGTKPYTEIHLAFLFGASAILWFGGILTPMLEVEAKIAELNFLIVGEPVTFTNQLIFYQSKSIIDFVWLMVQTGKAEMVFVGALIGLFSVIFPAVKLGASAAYVYDFRGLRRNKVLRFFALKSGKWSMADVMVVAIFMAYIGFSRLIDSQIGQIGRDSQNVNVLATDGTSLQIGFFMFLAFCLVSLVFSSVIEGMEANRDQSP